MRQSPSSTIGVGIAGLGRSGWRLHALPLMEMRDRYEVVAVADPDESRRREAVRVLRCRAYPEFDELVADPGVQLVVVATPNHLHREHVCKALRAGKDVVCEKPMAQSCDEVDEMISEARRTDRILTSFQNRRYFLEFLKLREIISSGKIGRIVQIRIALHTFGRRWDWQTLKRFGGGMLMNLGAHFVDLAVVLLGDRDPDVFCHRELALTCGDAEDHVKIILRPAGGPLTDIEITYCCSYPAPLWLVMGTSGGLQGTEQRLDWKFVDWSRMPTRKVETEPAAPEREYCSDRLEWHEESWTLPADAPSPSLRFYDDLHRSLRDRIPPPVTPESVRRGIAILGKCRKVCPL